MTTLIRQYGADMVYAVANERWLAGEPVNASAIEAELDAQIDTDNEGEQE